MASILVTGCEEDGADQSANVTSGLTSPRPPACLRISRRVCTYHGGKIVWKIAPHLPRRGSGVTLTRVLLRRDAYTDTRDVASRARDSLRRDIDEYEDARAQFTHLPPPRFAARVPRNKYACISLPALAYVWTFSFRELFACHREARMSFSRLFLFLCAQ